MIWDPSTGTFRRIFNNGNRASSQATIACVGAEMLFRALVRANSLEPNLVEAQVKAMNETTFFGRISFTRYGQLNRPPKIVQYDKNNQLQIVYPNEAKTMDYVYPVPNFAYRDCLEVCVMYAHRRVGG